MENSARTMDNLSCGSFMAMASVSLPLLLHSFVHFVWLAWMMTAEELILLMGVWKNRTRYRIRTGIGLKKSREK